MKKNIFRLISYNKLFAILFFTFTSNTFGQVIGVNTEFNTTSYCRNPGISTPIKIEFTYVAGTSLFTLEISDNNGVFPTTPVIISSTSILDPLIVNKRSFSYVMPSNIVGGTGYKFRVTGTASNITNSVSTTNDIDLRFQSYTNALTYNNNRTTINFCGGGSFLTIDPIGFPNLTYKWFKGAVTGTLIPGETGPSLFIDGTTTLPQGGIYYAEIDYGNCPNPQIQINVIFPGGSFATIFSTQGTTLTTGQLTDLKVTPLSVGETYKWYKDGVVIASATSAIYTTGAAGTYKCLVINSTCEGFTNPLTLVVVPPPPPNSLGAIPNLVSPNNDGVNDYWQLEPTDYGPNTNTDITIVSSQGETVLKTNSYTNNWPVQTIDFGAINPVYYYIISKQGQDERKGSITLIK